MAARADDSLRQAPHDLQHARDSLEDGTFEWAAFATQPGAEKAVKALYQRIGAEARGHSVSHPYTRAEAERLRADRHSLVSRALREGVVLFRR